MESNSCNVCGGDGRIGNSFGGSSTTCPGCRGTGRRLEDAPIFRDVTKTKPSHHQPSTKAVAAKKPEWPTTLDGDKLASEVRNSPVLSAETKDRLIHEIIDYEGSHGTCTQTFSRKIRKQLRAPAK